MSSVPQTTTTQSKSKLQAGVSIAVPLGYKRTEVGVIPEDWEVKQLGSLVYYTNGKAHENCIKDYGRYVLVNSKFISSEGEIKKHSDECFSPTSTGDVLMVMSDVPNGRAIAKCFFVDENDCYTVNQRICSLRPTNIDGKFLFYKLNRNPFYLSFDDGVKQTNLRKDEVLSCPLGIPKFIDEQRAIAEALSDVDGLIGALDKLTAKKQAIKQAAMQQLLTGKTRLPGFSGKWERKRLGDVFQFLSTANNSRSDLSDDGNVKYIHYGDIHTRSASFLDCKNDNLPMIEAKRVKGVPFLEDGDLVITDASEDYEGLGKAIEVRNATGQRVVAGLHTFLLRGDKTALADDFKSYLQFIPMVRQALIKIATGISVYGISKNNLGNVEVNLPSVEEQRAIATILSDMDAEIAALERRRDKTKQIKQGMMQSLLTGRVRLIENGQLTMENGG